MKKVICFCLLISLFVSCSHNKEYIKHNSQESKKVVILIYGLPSCGKLTVAKELSKKYDLNLMDNHFFNNILFPYIVLNNKNVVAMDPEIVKIRKIWMDNIVKYGKKDKGFVWYGQESDQDPPVHAAVWGNAAYLRLGGERCRHQQ